MRNFIQLCLLLRVFCGTFATQPRTRNISTNYSVTDSVLIGCERSCNGTNDSRELQRLVEANGSLYVGATNAILQLTLDLSLNSHFCNGPGNDGKLCLGPAFCSDNAATCGGTCENNYNTLLLPYRDRLLTCGTLYESCDLLMLSDVASIYGSARDLKCRENDIQQYISLSLRNRSRPVVAAIYVNQTHIDRDIFFLARSFMPFVTLLAPSSINSYFSVIDESMFYLNVETVMDRKPIAHLAWTTDEYGYILWSSASNPVITLSRYCVEVFSGLARSTEISADREQGARSYTEIPLRCNINGISATNVISAKIVLNKLYVMAQSNNTVAICTLSVSSLNEEFNFIREVCWNSTEGPSYARLLRQRNPPHCSRFNTYTKDYSTCAYSELVVAFLSPIAGIRDVALQNEMILHLRDDEVSSGFAIGLDNELVTAFIGTSVGNILKVRLGNQSDSRISEIIRSETGQNDAILESMEISEDGESLYAITKYSVYKVDVANCGQYESCNECLDSKDIYCGWCIYESRCSRKGDCPDSNQEDQWIHPNFTLNLCPRISQSQPSTLSLNTSSQRLELTFAGVDLSTALSYTCHFSVIGSDVTFQNSPLINFTGDPSTKSSCEFGLNSADIISSDRDHQNVTISILHNNIAVASGVLRVFSCAQVKALNTYTMCSSCASSNWDCSWCPAYASCVSDSSACSGDVITSNSSCPILSGFVNVNRSIPVGLSRAFQIRAERLPKPYNNYQCQIEFCGSTAVSSPTFINETFVTCDIAAEELSCHLQTENLIVFIRRGSDYVIDIPDLMNSSERTIFNCSAISSKYCGNCIAFRSQFNECGWCGDSCVVESRCNSSMLVSNIAQCEAGEINSVMPSSGPLEGGTEIEIRGTNLGSDVTQLTQVRVGSIDCEIVDGSYITSLGFRCITSNASSEDDSGNITVTTNFNATIQSEDRFDFKRVEADDFSPIVFLNQSFVNVSGTNLNVGSIVMLNLSTAKSPETCTSSRSSEMLRCPLPAVDNLDDAQFTLIIDNFEKPFDMPLRFVEVPTLDGDLGMTINTFRGAGRTIPILLNSFEGVQQIDLVIDDDYTERCFYNGTFASCVIPTQDKLVAQLSPTRTKRQAGRDTSGATYMAELVLNERAARLQLGTINYQPNPVVTSIDYPCERSNEANSSATVIIAGSGFKPDDSYIGSDYDISLVVQTEGNPVIPCGMAVVSDGSSIICRVQLEAWERYRSENVYINMSIGEFSFQSDPEACGLDIITIVVPICVGLVVILLICIVILVCRQKQKARMQEKQKKLILSKLDDLENRTRETARNAYFELQVGYMDNLADNLTHRIIYLSPERYFTQTLFNLSKGHPILDKMALKNESTTRMEAIKNWSALLKKRDFLMIFIRTLEEQKRFTVQEKGNMASLLTVCLFSDMPYFTDIMFDLLTELIQKHIHKNPKLLLRRSESVVEKMVAHWLSITLYNECIMEKCGEPIFLLTKAIHYLVSSGPCDDIAHKSLNSLNESTLLGAEISYNRKVLVASIQEEEKSLNPVDITVVDVDTITQVKAKIIEGVYKDRPFSECPKPDDLDLEMLSGETSKEGIILSDIDSTSVRDNNYTKINSVKHYNIPEKARVVLKPASCVNSEYRGYRLLSSSDSECSADVIQDDDPLSPTATAKTPLLNGKKNHLYHLINPKDDESSNDYIDLENGGGKKGDAALEDLIKNRDVQEIYLTRMVRAKSTLQDYVDKVFKSILCPDPIPHAVRFFFQFLDREAARHRISDSEVIHIWKTNSLLLRYWVNILKNPEFLFDINKTVIVDSCLNVITQAFMDACTTTNRKLGHDSPSNKLLYAKESGQYRNMVTEFFIKTANTPWIKDEDMDEVLRKTSQLYVEKFNQDVASQQLYQYLFKYKDQVLTAVRDNDREDLAAEIEDLMLMMDDRNGQSITTVV